MILGSGGRIMPTWSSTGIHISLEALRAHTSYQSRERERPYSISRTKFHYFLSRRSRSRSLARLLAPIAKPRSWLAFSRTIARRWVYLVGEIDRRNTRRKWPRALSFILLCIHHTWYVISLRLVVAVSGHWNHRTSRTLSHPRLLPPHFAVHSTVRECG